MAQIYKKQGSWAVRVYFYDNGKRKSKNKQGFRTKKEAEVYANELENKKFTGAQIGRDNITFTEYLERWFNVYKVGKHTQVTESRYPLILNVIKKHFNNRLLKDITKTEYQQFLNDYTNRTGEGKKEKRSKTTVRKLNGYIRAMAQTAIDDRIIYSDFTKGAVIDGSDGKKEVDKFMQADDFSNLKKLVLNELDFKATGKYIILTGILTGARYSEIVGLTWDDVDFKNKKLDINKTWDYKFQSGFNPTKNKSSIRVIDVTDELLSPLKQLKIEQQEHYLHIGYRDEYNLVFRNNRREIPSNSAVNKLLKSLENRLEFSQNYTFHSLRHSHVSYLLSKGIDIFYISKRIGHKDISVTEKVYSHLLDSTSKVEAAKALQALNEL